MIRASSSAEQRAKRVGVPAIGDDLEPEPAGERHLEQRHDHAAVRDVVAREQLPAREQRLERVEHGRDARGRVEIRRHVAELAEGLCERAATERNRAAAELDHAQLAVRAQLRRHRAADVDERRERGRDERTGATIRATCLDCVRIDIESLPTGIAMPSAIASSLPPPHRGVQPRVLAGMRRRRHPVGTTARSSTARRSARRRGS